MATTQKSDRSWYEVRALAGEPEAEVMIYDEIGGFGIGADKFVRDLKAIKAKTVNLRINTPGGSVFDGTAIYNAIRSHKSRFITHVDGLAASIGSIVAIAADEVRMAQNSYMMIHDPRILAFGDASDLRQRADLLDKVRGTLAETYMRRTGKSKDQIEALMAAETWMTADEALDLGFIDAVSDAVEVTAKFDLPNFSNVPEPIRAQFTNMTGRVEAPPSGGADRSNSEIKMELKIEQFKAYAAEHPEAVQDFVAQGYDKAKAELTPKAATATELVAAFPDDKPFCMDQMTANATLEQATTAYVKAQADKITAKDATIVELTAKLAKASEGQGPINTSGAGNKTNAPSTDNPKALAEWEWDNDPKARLSASSKEVYVFARMAELDGTHRTFSREPKQS